MPSPEVVKNAAALAGGKRVTMEIPEGIVRGVAGAAVPAGAPDITQEWLRLLLEKNAHLSAIVEDLSEKLKERAQRDKEDPVRDAALRIERLEATEVALMQALQKIADGQITLAKILASPVVPEYDKHGKLVSTRREIRAA